MRKLTAIDIVEMDTEIFKQVQKIIEAPFDSGVRTVNLLDYLDSIGYENQIRDWENLRIIIEKHKND